ncbi:MAG TPA: class II aldolase/adducin family protein [Holophagaceae bacterium]|jgi:L-fuculose-phosphate aldolase|nr:class II aldolase/adducin family protein [Holophagaceae bacterium]
MRMEALLDEVIAACRSLHGQGLLAAADGNVSVRLEDGRIAITPRGVPKASLQPQDFALLELDGTILDGTPSSERLMHLAVYRAVPEAKAVVHAHPATAIAWSLANPDAKELPSDALPEVILAAGRIPLVPMATPGTEEMGSNLAPFLPAHRLMILARHGGLAWGGSVREAAGGIERLEQVAKILLAAQAFGGAKPLAAPDLAALHALREKLGPGLL